MSYLLDTDWIISFLNGRPEAVDLVRRLADDGIAISVIAYGEVYEGLLGGSSPVERRVQLDEFVATVDVIAPNLDIARRYADIRLQLRQQGLPDHHVLHAYPMACNPWLRASLSWDDLNVVADDIGHCLSSTPSVTEGHSASS